MTVVSILTGYRFGLKQQRAVKIVGGYVVFTWLLMEILYLGVWCRPISQYWAVPVDNSTYPLMDKSENM
jgi:hypothetical protein